MTDDALLRVETVEESSRGITFIARRVFCPHGSGPAYTTPPERSFWSRVWNRIITVGL